jgi:hypothetical protein
MVVSDFMKQYTKPCEVSFIKMASYEGTSSTNEVKQLMVWTKIWLGVLLLFSRISLREYIGWIKRII